jgi:hypothetical protein
MQPEHQLDVEDEPPTLFKIFWSSLYKLWRIRYYEKSAKRAYPSTVVSGRPNSLYVGGGKG